MKRIFTLLLIVAAILFATSALIAAETQASGVVFANWLLHLNDQKQGKNYNAFDVTRAFVILDHKFNDKYSSNLIGDVNRESSTNGQLQFHLRSAYVQVNKLIPYTDMRFGMQGIIWFDMLEDAWSLRYIDAVSLDKLGFIPRADLGVSFIAHCPGNYGILALQVMNGGGYMSSEQNKYKDYILMAAFSPFPKNPNYGETQLWAQYYMGWPNIVDNAPSGEPFAKNTEKNRAQVGILFKYAKWVTAYGEYFIAQDDNDYTNNTNKVYVQKTGGFELFGKLNVSMAESFLGKIYIFSKYEFVDRNQNATDKFIKDDGDARYFLGGVGYRPVDGYEFALTISRNTINHNNNNIKIDTDEANSFMVNVKAELK
jgi:hypothetical protein